MTYRTCFKSIDQKQVSLLCLYVASSLTDPFYGCLQMGHTLEASRRVSLIRKLHKGSMTKTQERALLVLYGLGLLLGVLPVAAIAFLGVPIRAIGSGLQERGFCYRQGDVGLEKEVAGPICAMTWNICGLGGGQELYAGGVLPWPLRFEGIVSQIEHENPDLLCLQEVGDFALAEALFQRLRGRYAHLYLHVGAYVGAPSGLFLASKYPSEMEFVPFESYVGFSIIQKKGATVLNLLSEGMPVLRCIATHLQHGDGNDVRVAASRKAQLGQIMHQIKDLPDLPTVLMGDLNIERGSQEYHQSVVSQHFSQEDFSIEPTWSNEPARELWDPGLKLELAQLDYLCAYESESTSKRLQLDVRRSLGQKEKGFSGGLSDHLALVATIALQV
jgi:endonuclease/exonuclease/phosphatase family metal-dependent hydrolase